MSPPIAVNPNYPRNHLYYTGLLKLLQFQSLLFFP